VNPNNNTVSEGKLAMISELEFLRNDAPNTKGCIEDQYYQDIQPDDEDSDPLKPLLISNSSSSGDEAQPTNSRASTPCQDESIFVCVLTCSIKSVGHLHNCSNMRLHMSRHVKVGQ